MPILYRDSPSISFLFVSVSFFFFFLFLILNFLSPEFSCWHWLVYSLAYHYYCAVTCWETAIPFLALFLFTSKYSSGKWIGWKRFECPSISSHRPRASCHIEKICYYSSLPFFSLYFLSLSSSSSEGCERVFKLEDIYIQATAAAAAAALVVAYLKNNIVDTDTAASHSPGARSILRPLLYSLLNRCIQYIYLLATTASLYIYIYIYTAGLTFIFHFRLLLLLYGVPFFLLSLNIFFFFFFSFRVVLAFLKGEAAEIREKCVCFPVLH